MKLEPVILEGRTVRLEPLAEAHVEPLCSAAADPELWRWTTTGGTTPEEMRPYIRTAFEMRDSGTALPFATVERSSGRVVGSTRFANASLPDKRVEIGWTWISPPWQRTTINTEAKLLMLRHAFEVWGMNRVEFKTDVLNSKSRAALLRIGAKEEGIFRKHMVNALTGRIRDTIYFSILDTEWPEVQQRLSAMLAPRG
jgi:RimJ/RimL family protein N-acetyltransferase